MYTLGAIVGSVLGYGILEVRDCGLHTKPLYTGLACDARSLWWVLVEFCASSLGVC